MPSALAQDAPQLPSETYSGLQPLSSISQASLPPVETARLRTKDRQRRDEIAPYRFGKVVEASYRPASHGTWERLPSGDWMWRFRIHSNDAVSLSIGFTRFQLPEKASLFVYGPDKNTVRGPYTQEDVTNGQHWTPLVRGEHIIVELTVPADRRAGTALTLGKIVHGYRSLSGSQSKSGTCNLDVACNEADDWQNQVRATGGYTLTRGRSRLFCSGSLINNTAQDDRSLFLTAEHCVSAPSEATSMVFYWNFQTSQCRTQGTATNGTFPLSLADWTQTSTGATLLARYGNIHSVGEIKGKPDLTLVEVDDIIPAEYNLYLSGWSREDVPPQSATTVHHPEGHGKRISFDTNPTTKTAYLEDGGGNTHLRVGNWEIGTTQKGSSGAPLFNANKQIVGVLSGGFAGCGRDGDAEDNNRPDWYGRLAAGFTKADFQNRTFAEVLDPNNTGQKTLSGQDLTSPPPVSNFRISNVTSESATLRWDAPADKAKATTPATYEVRLRAERPINTRVDFESGRRISKIPSPSPGATQSVTVSLNPDTSYYFGIRTLDAEKNASSVVTAKEDATPVSTLRVKQPPSPNPAQSTARVKVSVEEPQTVKLTVYDLLGRRVGISKSRELTPFRLQDIPINVSSLSSGVYFLRIKGASTTRTEKIVVKR